MFTVTLDEALALFAQPKRGRGRTAAPPLRELGPDPTTGAPIVIKEGRFGPYMTDGEYNASVPRGESVEAITLERAAEMLAEKRAAGPPKKGRKKAAKSKKAAPKKAAAKKTATTKAAAKKAAAKKTAAKKASKAAQKSA